MSRRTLAGLVALPLLAALYLAAVLLPVPYVVYSPGVTVNVLGERDGKPIVQVSGHRTYRDGGALRMLTVYVTRPDSHVSLVQAVSAWIDRDDAVLPYDAVYSTDETQQQSQTESAVQMVSSQDAAVAVALDQLGYDVKPIVEVLNVTTGLPAEGKLQVRDVIEKVDGTTVTSATQVGDLVKASQGKPVTFVVRRAGHERTVSVTPREVQGEPRVGITPGPGYVFPFQVAVDIPSDIGGPSAGLMFSLAIYDTLTPGSLTDGQTVAGTGTIDDKGNVGAIGGIQQKVVAAREAGAKLFLVPSQNCGDVLGAHNGGMRLVEVSTMPDALKSIQAWVKDPGAALPTCEGS